MKRWPTEPMVVLMMGPTEFSPTEFSLLKERSRKWVRAINVKYLPFFIFVFFPSTLTFFPTKTNFTIR